LRHYECGRRPADAVGLNFYAHSPRHISPETAARIIAALPTEIVKVGLFVDTPAAEICRLFDLLHLHLIQLHGDQPPEFLAQLGGRPVMRAFRIGNAGLQPVTEYLDRCRDLAAWPKLVLLDALVAGTYGGTGKLTNWDLAHQFAADATMPPLVLAGGLTPENVAQAIQAVAPTAVDTASGVEDRPGQKDPAAVARFVTAARQAFGR
jgi:phosphoribosylanthranilate isomerase